MTDAFTETPAEKADSWTTLVAAILLGLAATLTALAAYQSAQLDGTVVSDYAEGNAALTASTLQFNSVQQALSADQVIFREWATATFEGKTDLADYTYAQMRSNLQESVDWLVTQDAVQTPFEGGDGNPYTGDDFSGSTDLAAYSDDISNQAAAADKKGDKFDLSTVLLALTLFFGGIATLFARKTFTITLLVIATVALGLGSAELIAGFAA